MTDRRSKRAVKLTKH